MIESLITLNAVLSGKSFIEIGSVKFADDTVVPMGLRRTGHNTVGIVVKSGPKWYSASGPFDQFAKLSNIRSYMLLDAPKGMKVDIHVDGI